MEIFENKSKVYRILREVELSIISQPVELKYSCYKYIHQDMYIIGIKGMTRKKIRNEGLNSSFRQEMEHDKKEL